MPVQAALPTLARFAQQTPPNTLPKLLKWSSHFECTALLISNMKSFLPVRQCNAEQSGDRMPMGRLSQEMTEIIARVDETEANCFSILN